MSWANVYDVGSSASTVRPSSGQLMVGYNQRSTQKPTAQITRLRRICWGGSCVAERLPTDHCAPPLNVDDPETFGRSFLTPLTGRRRRQYAHTVNGAKHRMSLYICSMRLLLNGEGIEPSCPPNIQRDEVPSVLAKQICPNLVLSGMPL